MKKLGKTYFKYAERNMTEVRPFIVYSSHYLRYRHRHSWKTFLEQVLLIPAACKKVVCWCWSSARKYPLVLVVRKRQAPVLLPPISHPIQSAHNPASNKSQITRYILGPLSAAKSLSVHTTDDLSGCQTRIQFRVPPGFASQVTSKSRLVLFQGGERMQPSPGPYTKKILMLFLLTRRECLILLMNVY